MKRIDARGRKNETINILELFNEQIKNIAAIEALQFAIQVDKETSNFRNAAKHHQEIAEIYESEIIDLNGAKNNWEQASNLYMADDSPA